MDTSTQTSTLKPEKSLQKTLKVALIQFAPQDASAVQYRENQAPEDNNSDLNLQQTETWVRNAAAKHAELIILPELHRSRYFCQTADPTLFDLAEPLNGPTAKFLGRLAKELNVVIVGSIFEKRMAGIYHNTAIVFDKSESLAGFYRKMHIPDDPGYYEKYYFTPGDSEPGFKPISTSVGNLGVLVCWDQWFPEAARAMALAGADLLIYPTAIGWDPADSNAEQQRQLNAWQTVQRGHAVANGIPVLACNRVGFEADPSGQTQGADFWGNSFAVGPQGEWLYNPNPASPAALPALEPKSEQIIVIDIEQTSTEQVRRIWPFFRDRRVDAYQCMLKRSFE